MSASKKLIGTNSGKPETALQKLKAAWLRLPEATQDYWREQFSSARKQSDIRAELARKLAVKLPNDSKLTKFRAWLDDQDLRDAEAMAQEEDQKQLLKEFGSEWTLDQIRDEVLRRSYARALATGDFAAGRKTIVQDLNVKKVKLDRDKFEWDAAQECLRRLPELKAVSDKPKLSPDEKAKAIQQILFPK